MAQRRAGRRWLALCFSLNPTNDRLIAEHQGLTLFPQWSRSWREKRLYSYMLTTLHTLNYANVTRNTGRKHTHRKTEKEHLESHSVTGTWKWGPACTCRCTKSHIAWQFCKHSLTYSIHRLHLYYTCMHTPDSVDKAGRLCLSDDAFWPWKPFAVGNGIWVLRWPCCLFAVPSPIIAC